MAAMSPLLRAFNRPAKWTDSERARTIYSTLDLLDVDGSLLDLRAIGGTPPDSKLWVDLYFSGSAAIRRKLLGNGTITRLEPVAFRKIFKHAERHAKTAQQRHQLMFNLGAFLSAHPSESVHFRPFVRRALASRDPWMRVALPSVLGQLDDLTPKELEVLHRPLVSVGRKGEDDPITAQRMNALNAVCNLLKRSSQLSPRVLSFCTSPELRAHYRRLHREDPSSNVRLCAHYVLKALKAARRLGSAR